MGSFAVSQIINIVPTTELEAVNSLLAAIGEAPVAQGEVDTPTSVTTTMALNELKNAAREVLLMGWKFNTEFGYPLEASATYAWTGLDGSTATLNVYKRPTTPKYLLRFHVSKIAAQQGSSLVDVILTKSRAYQEASAYVEVFYDRILNRDGLDSSLYTYLYIDPIWSMDFTDMPDEARRYITVLAGRRFIAHTVGSTTLLGFEEKDEFLALRALERQYGIEDDYNMMRQDDVLSFMGQRPFALGGYGSDPRRQSY